jgi:L-Ala-D/L-Glu epimerase / N-acetyl-D-glutamate racemase
LSFSPRTLELAKEAWPIAGSFATSRGAKAQADVVVVRVSDGEHTGRGECVPYARNHETVDRVMTLISSLRDKIEAGLTSAELQTLLPAGAARNAIDCALVDVEAKRKGIAARELFGLPQAEPAMTAYTISLGSADDMAAAAARVRHLPLLKIKLGGAGDDERLAAVREAAPGSALIVDPNESWTDGLLAPLTASCLRTGVKLIEQPLPAADDEALHGFMSPVPFCADESCQDRASLAGLAGKYQFINIKLDKTGGITEAVALARAAKAKRLGIMLGCNVATSLAMAPIAMLAPLADFIDLDGPLLLAQDREDGIVYDGAIMHPPRAALWG